MSITSGSAVNPPGWPRCSGRKPRGASAAGSTGRSASAGTIGLSSLDLARASIGYQTGIGTPL